jgi:hypothetical protein
VIALLKKEKNMEDLKKSMEGQMEVFLQDNTTKFVGDLFKTLESKDYLKAKKRIDGEKQVMKFLFMDLFFTYI